MHAVPVSSDNPADCGDGGDGVDRVDPRGEPDVDPIEQGLALVHYSVQRKHCLVGAFGGFGDVNCSG